MTHIDRNILRINGDIEDNIFVLNSSFETEANGGAGNDYYIYRANQFGRVTIKDHSSNNRLYFDQGLTVTAASISQSLLSISFEGAEDALRLRNFSSYDFFIGNTQDSLDHIRFMEFANRGFTVTNPVNPVPAITEPATGQVEIRANGSINIDRFSLGYDLRTELNGGAGRDIFEITVFQTHDVSIRDFSVGNLIRFESGVEIANFEINRGIYKFTLSTDNQISVLIGALQRYQVGDDAEIIDATELAESFAPTSLMLGDQTSSLPEGINSRAIKVATVNIVNADDSSNLRRRAGTERSR